MAEWSGRAQRQFGGDGYRGESGRSAPEATPPNPEAPAAVASPQIPGEVPDRSSVPGQHALSVPRATSVRRPLTERETAQGIMRPFAAAPGKERDPSRFEQATASFEELRKADPALLPPERPRPGHALTPGAVEPPALEAGAATGNARPSSSDTAQS
jgi:hypothetical protein